MFVRFGARLPVAVLAALLASCLTAGVASAELAVEPAGSITATSRGSLTFAGRGGLGEVSIACPVTLNGSLASSFDETREVHAGSVTSGSVGTCSGGGSIALSFSRAWDVTYDAIEVEPSSSYVDLLFHGVTATASIPFGRCEYRGDAPVRAALPNFPDAEELTLLGNALPLISGGAFCPSTGGISGVLALTATQHVQVINALRATPGSWNLRGRWHAEDPVPAHEGRQDMDAEDAAVAGHAEGLLAVQA